MLSTNEIRKHVTTKTYLKPFDLDVFALRDEQGNMTGIEIRSHRTGEAWQFKSNRAAKTWLTKWDNQIMCDKVNKAYGYGAYA